MNILFMSLCNFNSINERGIYTDLLRVFIEKGNKVFILSPVSFNDGSPRIVEENYCTIIKVFTGKIQKTNIIEKGINTILIEERFKKAIKTHLCDVKIDLILFPTPPITLAKAVEFVKKRDDAKSYLMLKDIFPQNAVDIGIMSKKGILYKIFRKKEKRLYAISDYIGCMSDANKKYLLDNNPEIDEKKVNICPNSIEPQDMSVFGIKRSEMRVKYGIPIDKKVFVYGGNLGKPQGIPFLIECLKTQKNNDKAFFLIVGAGTEYKQIEQFIISEKQKNVKLMNRLPKEDYDQMVGSCDVGMIFLDHRFTIPNFPSRLLSYMQAKMPVLAVTDPNTDIGKEIVEGEFGWWCESNDAKKFDRLVKQVIKDDSNMGMNGYQYLEEHYSSERSYKIIVNSLHERFSRC